MELKSQQIILVTELEKNKNIKLYKKYNKFPYPILEACKSNDLEAVKWLHLNSKKKCLEGAMNIAARNGNLEIVKFLHNNRSEGCTEDAMDWAAENGHLEIVKFLKNN